MNDIMWRAVKRAQIPVVKKPVGLSMDGKRPDGATLFPWAREKPLACDVTDPDTFAKSHLQDTATQACAAADTAADNKVMKYAHLATTRMFVPISVETGGSWNVQAVEFVQDLGKRISEVTNEPMETQFLFSACQRGNAIAFKSTFPADNF